MNRTRALVFFLVMLLFFSSAADLSAQYFGQNKVRYKTLDFKVLKTEHFDIHYYDEEESAVNMVGRMAERWYSRLARVLKHELSSRQPVIIYANSVDFRGTTVIPGFIGEATGGVTEALRRRVVLPLAGPLRETDHVLGHELVHAFQYDMTTTRGPQGSGLPGAVRLPLWFIEGMAEYLSLGPVDPHTAMWLRDAVRREDIPAVNKLDNAKYFPYRFGHALWAYVGGRFGDDVIGPILRAAGRSGNAERAISTIVKTPIVQLSQAWRQSLADQYEPILSASRSPAQQGRLLLGSPELTKAGESAGELNLSPVISPDGAWMVFYSEKDLFSIDLYLADARSGRIVRKITETAIDPHFDSFGFVNSAGSWSPDSLRFAYGGIANGRPRLTVYEARRGDVVKKIDFPELGEILSPAWSPDGRLIAFSAVANGVTDLFVYDLQSKHLRRLTHDPFADLDPAWSPDGEQLVFSTDRFSSNLDALDFGDYRLASLELRSGAISQMLSFRQGKHISPEWAKDGIYFVSDRNGVSNVYRLAPSTGETRQITNLQTGVSAISALSPALSVTASGDRLAFNAFLGRSYAIYVVDNPAPLAKSGGESFDRETAASLPPLRRREPRVETMLEDASAGLAGSSSFRRQPYDPDLELEYIAPPSLSLGVTPFGMGLGGGVALYFSDLLGQHNLITALQSSSYAGGNLLRNLAGTATYLNQKHRWTWGATGGQIPFLTGAFGQSVGIIQGQPVLSEDTIQFWQIDREVSGIAAYPFSRAKRVEFNVGFRSIDFAARRSSDLFLLSTGEFLGRDDQDLPAPDTINQVVGSAAFVHDTSVFGGTSSVMGRRYRFEVGMAGGGLSYASLLGDVRQYLRLARPLSLAGRIVHFGRYGSGARDSRLQDLFLGYPSLVRGYDPGSFEAFECETPANNTDSCPVFDRLLGSRIAVANAEMRLALLGPLGIWKTPSVPPIELAPFYDAGIAWNRAESLRFADLKDRLTSSYGFSLRVNLLGYAVAQISYVRPLDRLDRSTLWEFALIPGF